MTIELPPLYLVRQPLVVDEISDAGAGLRSALDSARVADRVRPGMRVAVTAGSRGIDRIDELLAALVVWLRGLGADPFLVTAMGSHGGATAEGRLKVLSGLGVNEAAIGARIRAEGETVVLGEVGGLPVRLAASAASADAIVVMNRVKPHTSFSGKHESGLCKMLAVGLGMAEGAAAVHALGARGLAEAVPAMAGVILARAPVLFGVGLIENGRDRLHSIKAMPAGEIMAAEPELLLTAARLKPGLPFEAADVLVVDWLGKDLSGTGMDTKVIGRLMIAGEPEPESPRLRRVVALRLTPATAGNAYGIGLADLTTTAVTAAMKPELAAANARASTFVERARVPLALPTDREAVLTAAATCGNPRPESLSMARVHSTLVLEEMHVTGPLLERVRDRVEVISGPEPWPFDAAGNLTCIPLSRERRGCD